MKIANCSTQNVYWRTFNASDSVYFAGLKDGVLQPGASVTWETNEAQVKIEFKQDGLLGPPIVRPTLVDAKSVALTNDRILDVNYVAAPLTDVNEASSTAAPLPDGQPVDVDVRVQTSSELTDVVNSSLAPVADAPAPTSRGTTPVVRPLVLKQQELPELQPLQLNLATEYFWLTTAWQGDDKVLDVVDGRPQLNSKSRSRSQAWKIKDLGDGYSRIERVELSDFSGVRPSGPRKSLDVQNDGQQNNRIILADSGNYTGQHWKRTPLPNGYFRLTTRWQGEAKSLDILNDGHNNQLILADSGNYSGQQWKVTKIPPDIVSEFHRLDLDLSSIPIGPQIIVSGIDGPVGEMAAFERRAMARATFDAQYPAASQKVAACFAELLGMITLSKERPNALTAGDRAVMDYFSSLVKQKRLEVAQAAVDEYNRWASDPYGYYPPKGCQYNRPSMSPLANAFSSPKPPPCDVYGVAKVYGSLAGKDEEVQKTLLALSGGMTITAVAGVGAAAVAPAVVTSATGTLFSAVFPHAAIALGILEAGSLSTSGMVATFAAGFAGAASFVVMAVVIGVMEGISVFQAAELPGKLQQKLAAEKATPNPNLSELVSSETGAQELLSVLLLKYT